MKQNYHNILRAARNSTKYSRGHEWEPGTMHGTDYGHVNGAFKPCFIRGHDTDAVDFDQACRDWPGDFGTWTQALEGAGQGIRYDFYVRSVGRYGELITNVYIILINELEAIVQDCGEVPYRVVLSTIGFEKFPL